MPEFPNKDGLMRENSPNSRNVVIAVVVAVVVLATSCTATTEPPPPISIADEFTNVQIKIRVAPILNSFRIHDAVLLELRYDAENVIILPNDYNLRIFELRDNTWEEINEIPTERLPLEDTVFSPDNRRPAIEDIFVAPDIKDLSRSHRLRVYVSGDMITDDGIEKVTAYVDFELHP